MIKGKNILIRGVLLVTITATLFFILRPARDQVRYEYQSKQSLLTLQQALQKFHVDDEAYPRKTPMAGAELIRFLLEAEHLSAPPLNPATLLPYTLDGKEADPILYTTDEQAETYSLKVVANGSNETLIIVDSTQHHSLE